jgi:hypothetical protein
MKPPVRSLRANVSGKAIVLTSGRADGRVQVDVPSPGEPYLGCPLGDRYDVVTHVAYYAESSVEFKRRSESSDVDQCQPSHDTNPRRTPILCMPHSVHPRDQDRFAVPLLPRNFPARSLEDLRTRNGRIWGTFSEAAHEAGPRLTVMMKR